MNRFRAFLLAILVFTLIITIVMCLLVSDYWQEQHNHFLIDAIKASDTDKALAALDSGADPNTRDYIPSSPSFRHNLQNALRKIIYLNSGSEPKCPAAIFVLFGERCRLTYSLHNEIAYDYNVDLLRILIDHGINPNIKNERQQTPLMLAAKCDDENSVRLLIKKGAEVNTMDVEGKTALDYILYNIKGSVITSATDPNNRNDLGFTRQKDMNDTETVTILRNAGAKTGNELHFQSAKIPKQGTLR